MGIRRGLAAALALAGLAACTGTAPSGAAPPRRVLGELYPEQPIQAPPLRLPSLAGEAISLSQYRGQLVLLHFWATWCHPCKRELPELQSLWLRRRDAGLAVVTVATDRSDIFAVRALAEQLALEFPVLYEPGDDVRVQYQVADLPLSYLIGRDGQVIAKVVGSRDWTHPAAVAWIDRLLAGER